MSVDGWPQGTPSSEKPPLATCLVLKGISAAIKPKENNKEESWQKLRKQKLKIKLNIETLILKSHKFSITYF